MCKLEMMTEWKKRMELNKIVNVLVAELERQNNFRENVAVRSLREEVDRLFNGKVEVRNEVSVRLKNGAEGGRSKKVDRVG